MTYATLQADIADYLHRTDLTAVIPAFIRTAESGIFRELQIKETETSVTGVTVDGYAVLPTDFGSVSKVSVTYGGSARVLDYIALSEVSTTVTAVPGYYSFENGNLRIWGTDDGQAYTLYYIPKFSNLSDITTTNWLLDNAADLYLYAACLEAARYTKDDGEIARLTPIVGGLTESVRRFSERTGKPLTGSLQIKRRT